MILSLHILKDYDLNHPVQGHCTPRALPQDDYVILRGASRGMQSFSVKLPRLSASCSGHVKTFFETLQQGGLINKYRENASCMSIKG
jgi:hypothetical protein